MDLLAPFQTDARMSFTIQLVWVTGCVLALVLAVYLFGFRRADRKIDGRDEEHDTERTPPPKPTPPSEPLHERLLKKVKSYASLEYGLDLESPIEVTPTDPFTLDQHVSQAPYPTPNTASVTVPSEEGWQILILEGMEEAQQFAAIAHEFAHVWQQEEGFYGGDTERREGFAEWVTCKLSGLAGYDYEALQREMIDDLAASGMRKLFIMEDQYGTINVVKAAKSNQLNLKAIR